MLRGVSLLAGFAPYSILLLLLLMGLLRVNAWKDCPGGGVCPDYATCCESNTPGIPSCIPTRHGKDPENSGSCCDATTGCPYGFSCATKHDNDDYCQMDTEHPPQDLFHDQPRYEMCQIKSIHMTKLHGFPIRSPNSHPQLAYYSNMGDITKLDGKQIQKVLIMIHGSGRTAEDYFCVAMSLIDDDDDDDDDTVLVLAPKFLAPSDQDTDNSTTPFLVWQETEDETHPMSHTWRYGADALNAPISSYEALDRLTEYLATQLYSIKQITVAGHSAGGQVTHRWALLSTSFVWKSMKIRAIVANPRSYCYLDGRRILFPNKSFDYPSSNQSQHCPDYNYWNWGLENGGDLYTPYKDRALAQTPRARMAERYATSRKVVYLTGAYDVLPQKDHCATYELQGKNRHERALNYFDALTLYTNNTTVLVHELFTIPESPHDHLLM